MIYFNLSLLIISGIIWLSIIFILRQKKKKSFIFLLLFTIFYIYIFKVLDYTLFQFQSLVLLKYFMPNLILQGQEAGKSINLIPIISLTSEDLKTSLLNILLFIPFGFGLPFISNLNFKKVVIVGMVFSISIELLQLMTGLISSVTFRIADINDLIFNTMGVFVGFILFIIFLQMFNQKIYKKETKNSLMQYISKRPQIKKRN